jgi:hypothetical protein
MREGEMAKNNKGLQREIEMKLLDVIRPLVPSDLNPRVQLRGQSGRSNGEGSPIDVLSVQEGDSIVISFESKQPSRSTTVEPAKAVPPSRFVGRFKPVAIRGEPLSVTVMRDRR